MPPPLANEGIDISVLVYHPEIDLKYLKCNSVKGLLWTSLTIRPELKTPNLLAKINDIPDHAMQKVYYDAFAVLEDELLDKTGAFRMSPTMERVLPVTKLRDIVNKREFGGILIVTKEHSAAFEESYNECKDRDMDPLSKLAPGDRAIIEQHHLVPYAEVAFRRRHKHDYNHGSLAENRIRIWSDEILPSFVQGKIEQLQAKRQWQYLLPEGIFVCRECFRQRQLDFNEFVTVEQLVLSFPDAPPVYNRSTFLDNHNIPLCLEETRLLNLLPQIHCEPQNFEASGREMLNMVGKWASSLSRYINIPELQKGGPALWPDKMGILTLEPLTANAKLHTLRHVRPRSDWAVFDGVPVVLVELDSATKTQTLSTARMTQSSASTTDSHGDKPMKTNITLDMARGLAYAAVVVRSTNIALKTNNYCLPYIWVSKLWHASCYVVYQSSADILAYPLQYKNQDYFDLTDQHAKAHFQLRLLNIVDSRMRSLSEAQAKTVLNVCTQFRLGVGDLVSEDLSDDEDSEDDLPEAKRWRQMAPSSVQDLSDDEDSEDDLPEAKRWRQTAPSSVHSKS